MTRSTGRAGAAELPAPVASRIRRPSWRDPRLLVGILLVLCSLVGGGRVVAMADDSQPFYVLDHEVTPGDSLTSSDLRISQVRLPEAGNRYLAADRPLPAELVARRPLGAGELVPLDAVGAPSSVTVQPVAVPVEGQLPTAVRKGGIVDIWVAEPDPAKAGTFRTPRQLVAGAAVAEVQRGGGTLAASSGATVQVLLEPEQLPEVLSALANKGVVSVLPSAGA